MRGEAVGPEEVLQDVVPLLRRRPQEPLELALGQQRHLDELVGVMPIRSVISSPTSAAREDRKWSSPWVVSVIDAAAFSGGNPSPRFFGRDHSGSVVRRSGGRAR